VKTDLHAKLQQELPGLLPQFVLAHPIAGGENSGVEASVDGLFADKHVIMTSCPQENPSAVETVRRLWQAVGAKTVTMSLFEHDSIFAKTSHLPHVVAFSLVNYLNSQTNREQLFELAAAGFYDFTRIASSDAEMWRDICVTNKEQVVDALDGYVQQLQQIRSEIHDLDQTAILRYFQTAKQTRDIGLAKK
jgi:prephenate dehydrogenase